MDASNEVDVLIPDDCLHERFQCMRSGRSKFIMYFHLVSIIATKD